jgi:predicted nucleic acid-binding protein
MISIAVVDTGPLVASANKSDPDHIASVSALRSSDYALVIPALCIAEATYLIGEKKGAAIEAAFLRGLEQFNIQEPVEAEWMRIAQLVEKYSDLRLGGTDASVVALAERFGTDILITLDRKHFNVVRPRHCQRFRLLP